MNGDELPALGASVEPGGVRFAVWSPRARSVELVLPGERRRVPMVPGPGARFTAWAPGLRAGADYLFALDGGGGWPDPRSRWQPGGVHGPSRVVDPGAFAWTDQAWRGLPLVDFVLYELHVGSFTPEGTFEAAITKLPHLRALGVTAVELMPVAEFAGARNWGYDGVDLFAPHSRYGGPDALRRFVDACHAHGLAAVLDVVFNHLGPEGNYLGQFGPYFSDRHRTPWGAGFDLDGPDSAEVRRFFVDNARAWLSEFHFDALRLDAVQDLVDHSPCHLLEELVAAVEAHAAQRGRQVFAIAENNQNDVRLIEPAAEGGRGLHAQWNDDFHHALFAALTGDRRGHRQDFGPLADVAKALTEGFVNDGRRSVYRGRAHGTSSARRPGQQLVCFIQNHDQVANGCGGQRLSALLTLEKQKLALALLCCAPGLPLLFMGQEWGETAPFLYFTSHGDEALAAAVREGRARQLEALGVAAPDDPQAEATFAACKLRWELTETAPHAQLLRCTSDLLALRRATPALAAARKDLAHAEVDEARRWLVLSRAAPPAPAVCAAFNFDRGPVTVPLPADLGSGRLVFSTADARYGGPGPGPPIGLARVTLPPSSAAIYLAP